MSQRDDRTNAAAGPQRQGPADAGGTIPTATGRPSERRLVGWLLPIVAVLAVAAGVWWFVTRESREERGTRLLAEARQALESQDYVTAEARLQQALRIAPRNGVLLHNLGVLYMRQDRLAEARTAFERAVAVHAPEASQVRAEDLFQLASISYAEEKWAQTAQELERAIAADPTRGQLHARLLDLQLGRLESPAAAESTTARFLRLCGRTPRTLGDAAFLYYQHESHATAEALARQAVALEDSFVEGHALIARCRRKTGNPHDALKELAGPLARYPRVAELWVAQALLLIDVRQREAALAAADRAVQLAPRDFDAHQARQKALSILGRYQEAIGELDAARELTEDPAMQRRLLRQQGLLRRMLAAGTPADMVVPAENDSGGETP